MKLGIMQPYFFPYMGHFALIANTDAWVVFDVTQYTPKTWMTRNRVLHPSGGPNYINVPLANGSIGIKTCEARVLDPAGACCSLLGKLSHYRQRAPYFKQVEQLLQRAFAEAAGDSLVALNTSGLKVVCDYLEIPFNYRIASEQDWSLPDNPGPGGWAPCISEIMGAQTYVNPLGGRELFDVQDFNGRGIELRFLEFDPYVYTQRGFDFEPHLSILDALMWNAPQDVRAVLHSHARLVA